MSYQPLYQHGSESGASERDCAARYALIRPVIDSYRRAITVLDLGANLGYFGLRLADESLEHGPLVTSVMVEREVGLVEACAINDLPNTIALRTTITVEMLEALADCEHFDVVLCLNLLHHLDDPVRALAAVLRLGEQIVIETPPPLDTGACGDPEAKLALRDALRREAPTCLGQTPSHTTPGVSRPLLHFVRPKPRLAAPYLYPSRLGVGIPPLRDHAILSTDRGKTWAMPDKGEERIWFPGINLWTYAQLGGSWPPRHEVLARVEAEYHRALDGAGDVRFLSASHGDVRPWNFILSGEAVTLIDWNDPRQTDTPDPEGLRLTLAWVQAGRKL